MRRKSTSGNIVAMCTTEKPAKSRIPRFNRTGVIPVLYALNQPDDDHTPLWTRSVLEAKKEDSTVCNDWKYDCVDPSGIYQISNHCNSLCNGSTHNARCCCSKTELKQISQ